MLAGYYRGAVDEVLMRVVDVLLAFPGILLNIAIVALIARPGVGVMIFALALNGWVGYARVARGQVLSLRERDYVLAARAIGARPARIMWRHIFPNLLSPILVQMSFAFGGVILVEASLSFLGLGPQVDYTWGALLDQGTTYLWKTQRLALVPGLAIMLVVLGSNLLGDGLRDRFDPSARSSDDLGQGLRVCERGPARRDARLPGRRAGDSRSWSRDLGAGRFAASSSICPHEDVSLDGRRPDGGARHMSRSRLRVRSGDRPVRPRCVARACGGSRSSVVGGRDPHPVSICTGPR